jgi:hypothetical protein
LSLVATTLVIGPQVARHLGMRLEVVSLRTYLVLKYGMLAAPARSLPFRPVRLCQSDSSEMALRYARRLLLEVTGRVKNAAVVIPSEAHALAPGRARNARAAMLSIGDPARSMLMSGTRHIVGRLASRCPQGPRDTSVMLRRASRRSKLMMGSKADFVAASRLVSMSSMGLSAPIGEST